MFVRDKTIEQIAGWFIVPVLKRKRRVRWKRHLGRLKKRRGITERRACC